MTTRLTFSIIIVGALLLTGFSPCDATAQPRPVANKKKQATVPSIQSFPQVQHPSIQQTINNAYMNEWSQRAALNQMLQPKIIIQPYPYYPYGYLNGYYPNVGNPYVR